MNLKLLWAAVAIVLLTCSPLCPQPTTESPATASDLEKQARARRAEGRLADAEELLRKRLELRVAELGAGHADLAADYEQIGRLALSQMKVSEAEELFRQGLAIVEATAGPEDLRVIPALHNLVLASSLTTERKPEVEILLKRIVAVREKNLGFEHEEAGGDRLMLGRFQAGMEKYKDAEANHWLALLNFEKNYGRESVRVTPVLESMAGLFMDLKRFMDAEFHLRRSIALKEAAGGPLRADLAQPMDMLGAALFKQNRFEEAIPVYARALRIFEMSLGVDHPLISNSLESLAVCYASLRRYSEAEPLYRRALDIREKLTASSLNHVALIGMAQDQDKEPEALFKLALGLLERAEEPVAAPVRKEPAPAYAISSSRGDYDRNSLLYSVLENYADLLDKLQRPPAAAKIRARLKGMQGPSSTSTKAKGD